MSTSTSSSKATSPSVTSSTSTSKPNSPSSKSASPKSPIRDPHDCLDPSDLLSDKTKLRLRYMHSGPGPFFLDYATGPTPQYLQTMSQRTLELPNWMPIREYRMVVACYCAPTLRVFAGAPEANIIAKSFTEHMDKFEHFLRATPKYRLEVQNTSVELDEGKGTAVVFVSSRLSGIFDDGTVRESITKLQWKRQRDGRWLTVEMCFLRGPGLGLL